LFAVHQFIEGFVWLALDGVFVASGDPEYGRAICAVCAGLLPFVIPLSVLLFEPDMKNLGACRYFWRSEGNYAVYALGVDRSLNYAAAIWG
jgi:hypothetical protein